MTHINEDTKTTLERLITEDLENATVVSASVAIQRNGEIVIDEIVLKTKYGRRISPGLMPRGIAWNMILETWDEYDPGPPVVQRGWRPATIEQDYAEVLADLTGGVD